MMIAAGPYTLDDDMLYHPLAALIDVARTERPDVLILVSGWTTASDRDEVC